MTVCQHMMMCPFCLRVIAQGDAAGTAGVYLTHTVDEHWDELSRIRATTGDSAARERLAQQVHAEMMTRRRSN